MLLSLLLVGTPAYASDIEGGGSGGGNVTTTGKGTFDSRWTGYRMYMIDDTGKLVTNKVDILFNDPANAASNYKMIYNTKFETFNGSSTERAKTIQVGTLQKLNSSMPRPVAKDGTGKYIGYGEKFRQWMLDGLKVIQSSSSYTGGAGSGGTAKYTYKGTTTSTPTPTPPSSSSSEVKTVADVNRQIRNAGQSQLAVYKTFPSLYTRAQVIAGVAAAAQRQYNQYNNSDSYTQAQKELFRAALTEYVDGLDHEITYDGWKDSKSADASNITNPLFDVAYASNLIEITADEIKSSLFDVAYAADTTHKAGENANIIPLLNCNSLFEFKSDSGVVKAANGLMTDTLCQNNLKLIVEPIFWFQPATVKSNGDGTYSVGTSPTWWFYGTVTNYAQLMVWNKANGKWHDGGSGKGGWYSNVINKIAATSLYLDKPLMINNDSKTLVKTVALATSPIPNSTLKQSDLGYAMHWYTGGMPALPSTHTYDNSEKNPNPEPHPAPNPDPDHIPLCPSEPKDPGEPITPENKKPDPPGYLNTTRTVKIIKVYDILNQDGTLTHVKTLERDLNPGTIAIQHEPGYKTVAYFTSEQYYGWEVGPITENLEWPQFNENPVIIKNTEIQFETEYDTVKDKAAGDTVETIKIGVAADPSYDSEKSTDPPKNGYHDIALYQHLVMKPKDPETHTFDDPNTPGPAPDPLVENPEYDTEEIKKQLVHRIVKVYESEEQDGSITTDSITVREQTAGIIQVETENPPEDPGYQLIQWQFSNKYNGTKGTWAATVAGIPVLGSGTSATKVDIRNPSDKFEERTLFVRLRKPYKGVMPGGDIIIQESQISKAIHTDAKDIGGRWGNYHFQLGIGPFQRTHTYYIDHGCCGSCDPPCGSCHGHTCSLAMPGIAGDNKLNFVFAQIGSLDPLQIPQGVHSLTDPVVRSRVNQPETISGMNQSKYSYNSDGNDSKGEELITVLWRGSSLLNDKPTLVKYKQTDIINKLGQQSWDVPQAMLKNESNVSKKTRVKTNGQNMFTLLMTFGIDKGASDIVGIASCGHSHRGSPCPYRDVRYAAPIGGTDWTYDFQASVNILVYASKAKVLADEPFNGAAKKNKTVSTGEHFENTVIQDKQQIKFFPYIKMTYMTNSLNLAELEEQNKTTYAAKSRYETYVLSEYESSILPSDAVEVGWINNNQEESLLLTSQQWSLHQRAIGGGEAWNGRNQVLPGGAIYQLSTPADRYTNVKAITYQTVVDQKTRQYLSTSLSGTEYTEAQVAKDHTDFINNVKETLDNLRIVQWVDKNYNDTKAWPNNWQEISGDGRICVRGGGESIAELGLALKTNLEDKYYMKKADNLIPYTGKLLGDKTENLMDTSREKANEGDLDIISVNQVTTVFKVFTDTAGNVYMASTQANGVVNTESVIKNLVSQMKDLNADTMGSSGASVVKLFDRRTGWAAANSALSGDAKQIDDRTSFITNIVKALNRNQGSDKTANWAKTDGKWYNEAFDGIYLVRQATTMEIGLKYSGSRASALDPALCPANNGQSDLYTNAFLSQFCLNDKSDATIAQGKDERYIGTFKGMDITMPDMEGMYQSRKFYIPNANVQDLK